ncbi:MAG: hypothetical protein IJ899_12990 [Blautia sp.]|nr:hypothetical protein [Blautia sp.]
MGDLIKEAGIRCDKCGSRFLPHLKKTEVGEWEITTFACPFCHKGYLVSITDRELRKEIQRYSRLSDENKIHRLSLERQEEMQKLKASNMARSRELKEKYRKEARDGEEKENDGSPGDEYLSAGS